MTTRWLVLLPFVLALCGCSGNQVWDSQPHRSLAAWDGPGRDPKLRAIKRARAKPEEPKSAIENREAELAGLREYSREWVTLRREIDAEEDARIAKILVICRGCEAPSGEINQTNQSSSLTPNRRTTEALR
jgi:hypothetical protein